MAESVGEKRGGLVGWLIRRFVRPALAPEIDATHAALERLERESHEQLDRIDATTAGLRQDAHEFRAHAERRLDQLQGELSDLRASFLDIRQQFEGIRDRTVPDLEKRLDALADEGIARLQHEIAVLSQERVGKLEAALAQMSGAVSAVQADVARVRDTRLGAMESATAAQHDSINLIQQEFAELRDDRLRRIESDLERVAGTLNVAIEGPSHGTLLSRIEATQADLLRLQGDLVAVQALAEEVRDDRLPVLSARVDALIERLNERLVATSGLLDRLVRHEPLGVASGADDSGVEVEIPSAVRAASRQFMDQHRGQEAEILDRAVEYLPLLETLAPILDIGCGRGELLRALTARGIESSGIDSDPALVKACRDEGLAVQEADLLAGLRDEPSGRYGAVTAIHVFEHMPAAKWMQAFGEAARVVRPGGLVIVECPNPGSLRVGASLFWTDPTHDRPVHSDAIAFVMRAVGLEVEEVRFMRPFPADQSLVSKSLDKATAALATRLDEWLSGPRDVAVIGRRPAG